MANPDHKPTAKEAHEAERARLSRAPSAASKEAPKPTPGWQEVFLAASPAQRANLLALADRQGLLYGHQLPTSTNGQPRDEVRQFLKHVFTGAARDLTPVTIAPFDCLELDAGQRSAVARALATPDICLVQGLPATGKSRVAAEIVTQYAERGERVLLVAPRTASVDRVLDLVHGRSSVCGVRCLGSDERLDVLPESIGSLVFTEQLQRLQTQTQRAADQRQEEAERRHAALTADAALWPQLLEIADRHDRLLEQSHELTRRRETIPESVATIVARLQVSLTREAPQLAPEHEFERDILSGIESQNRAEAAIENSLADLAPLIQSSKDHLARLTADENSLAPLAEAKAGGRWWKLAWWQASFRGNVAAKAEDLQARIRQAKEDLARLEEDSARFHSERRQLAEKARACQTSRIEQEIARRLAEIDSEEACLASELSRLDAKRLEIVNQLHTESPPVTSAVADLRTAMSQWQQQVEAASGVCDNSRLWADALRHDPEMLANQIRSCINLVAASFNGLASDPYFNGPGTDAVFDLLIVEHAESITEAEFIAVARRCRRWVLIAESMWPETEPAPINASPPPRQNRRPLKPSAPSFFQRLWSALHCDPSRLPYVWVSEVDNRLCCRLRSITPEQRRWLEIERVADFHDIELRIVAPPRGKTSGTDSFLAEVVFPPAMSIAEAKAYIFRELEEVPVRAHTRSVGWEELPDSWRLRLTTQACHDEHSTTVCLAPGVRELICNSVGGEQAALDWHTHSVVFDRAAGWERNQAEAWAAQHLGLLDLGRTALLNLPCGFTAGISAFLSDILLAGHPGAIRAHGTTSSEASVEFVPVPSLPRGGHRSSRQTPRLPNGAGLEVDLADPRHRDRLPTELHTRLEATRGFANYPEAQAVVRAVTQLARERSSGNSMGRIAAGASRTSNGLSMHPVRVGVVALYAGQAQLIRLLLEAEAGSLASAGLDVRVDVPIGFLEQECTIALVSLTRSHSHRAASLGEGPAALATALTRGRCRLILFGDPGTLGRRVEWQAPLDHLDEAASGQERGIVRRLLQYILGEGKYQREFAVRHDHALSSATLRIVHARRPVGREGSNA
jgi:hypothetical protein